MRPVNFCVKSAVELAPAKVSYLATLYYQATKTSSAQYSAW